ncbi:unnamed protein product [Amoebophrya sp. A120]|nr:unnamed protein product [Amoebophrya sp. A120]|eukprot:GSA120T00007774001.1
MRVVATGRGTSDQANTRKCTCSKKTKFLFRSFLFLRAGLISFTDFTNIFTHPSLHPFAFRTIPIVVYVKYYFCQMKRHKNLKASFPIRGKLPQFHTVGSPPRRGITEHHHLGGAGVNLSTGGGSSHKSTSTTARGGLQIIGTNNSYSNSR